MRIAVPVANGKLAQHFGHTKKFAFIDVDGQGQRIASQTEVDAPEHQPGRFPEWLRERGVHLVIAGRMGSGAQERFAAAAMEVRIGAPHESAETLVRRYLDGTLVTGGNGCDHRKTEPAHCRCHE